MARQNKYETPKPKQLFMRKLQPKNLTQELYMEALRTSTVTIGTGAAGVGKTFIATAIACEKLINGEVSKIVLTRPVVEAGEKLGFLPGTLEEKIHPYLLPLLDGLNTHLSPSKVQELMRDGKIEIAPLAFMRGRTFDNCYVILDEAENTTQEQMKLFLTRVGAHSFMSVNGDHTQTDLDKRIENGLTWATRKLRGKSNDIQVIEFRKSDIVRHPLIGFILDCLEAPDNAAPKQSEQKPVLLG